MHIIIIIIIKLINFENSNSSMWLPSAILKMIYALMKPKLKNNTRNEFFRSNLVSFHHFVSEIEQFWKFQFYNMAAIRHFEYDFCINES